MSRVTRTTGYALALAAATMFASVPVTAESYATVGKCMGVNACSGQSECKTAASSCKGLNSCKGQGWVEMKEKACKKAGGSFEE
jgi:hypothetical protein